MSLPEAETRYIQLSQDRRLSYCEYGDPAGRPVFYHHGTPGSRLEPHFGHRAGKDHGYRIIALDRPGIGHSDEVKGRTLLDWPSDINEVATQLGIDHFGVVGVSGGGPYALACSYAMPDQVDFAVLMGSWAPVAEEPALWQAMAPLDRVFGRLSRSAPWAFYLPFSLIGVAAKLLPPQGFIRSIDSSMSDADRELMQDDSIARFFAEDVKEAFRQGVRAPADDALILYGEWGFRVGEIPVAVDLHHGSEDKFAPPSYATYLNDELPRSNLHLHPGQGHLFVMTLFDKVFEQLPNRA